MRDVLPGVGEQGAPLLFGRCCDLVGEGGDLRPDRLRRQVEGVVASFARQRVARETQRPERTQ